MHTILTCWRVVTRPTTKGRHRRNGQCHRRGACRSTDIQWWWHRPKWALKSRTNSFRLPHMKLTYAKFSHASMKNTCAEIQVPFGILRLATHNCRNTNCTSIVSFDLLILSTFCIFIRRFTNESELFLFYTFNVYQTNDLMGIHK